MSLDTARSIRQVDMLGEDPPPYAALINIEWGTFYDELCFSGAGDHQIVDFESRAADRSPKFKVVADHVDVAEN